MRNFYKCVWSVDQISLFIWHIYLSAVRNHSYKTMIWCKMFNEKEEARNAIDFSQLFWCTSIIRQLKHTYSIERCMLNTLHQDAKKAKQKKSTWQLNSHITKRSAVNRNNIPKGRHVLYVQFTYNIQKTHWAIIYSLM